MSKQFPSVLLLLFLLSFSLPASATASSLDSLRLILLHTENDTAQVNAMNAIMQQFIDEGNYDSALFYCNQSVLLAKKAEFNKGLSFALTARGKLSNNEGNFPQAIKDFQSALYIYQQEGDKKNIADQYNLIANAYHLQEDFPNALKNQYAALKLREEIHDETGMAWSYNNIGTIYRMQGDYAAAMKNFLVSLKLLEKTGDKKNIAMAHNNIGTVFSLQGNLTDALKSYIAALKIRQAIGNKDDIIASYVNIGDAFCDLYEKDSVSKDVLIDFGDNDLRTIPRGNWLDTAMNIQSSAHAMTKETGNKYFSIFSLSGMGRTNFLKKNYPASIKLYSEAYAIAEEMNALELQKEIAKYLADNYDRMKDFKNSMNWYQKYTAHKDTLVERLKSDDLTRTRMKYEFEKKENAAKAIQDKKDALAKVELSRQKKMRNIFIGGFSLVLVFAGIFFYQRNSIRKEKNRSEDLLLNILPGEVANELKETGTSRTKSFEEVTVLFADFVDFTIISEKLTPELLVEELHTCFSAFDHIIQKHKVEKIKTIGDAYLCVGGIPVADPDHAIHVINAAVDIINYMEERKKQREQRNEIPFMLRIGIHSGPVVAGIVGVKKYAYDIWGDTVNTAARMEQNSLPGKINISSKTYELIKDKFKCTYRGKIEAKNLGEIDMYFLDV